MRDTSPIDALKEYLDRWAAAHLSCEPADRADGRGGRSPCLRDGWPGAAAAHRLVWRASRDCPAPGRCLGRRSDRRQREGGDLRPGAQQGRHLRGSLLERGAWWQPPS